MKLILIGTPGSGKSTQGNLLSEKLSIPYLSTGHIFRTLAQEATPLGRDIKRIMSAGLLVSDEKTLQIVSEYLQRPEYQKGYILDGFPRTLVQAESFTNGIDKVIFLRVGDEEIIKRLSQRSAGREDDTIEAIKKRIEVFKEFTLPVINYYKEREKLLEINGEQKVEDIHGQIINALTHNG